MTAHDQPTQRRLQVDQALGGLTDDQAEAALKAGKKYGKPGRLRTVLTLPFAYPWSQFKLIRTEKEAMAITVAKWKLGISLAAEVIIVILMFIFVPQAVVRAYDSLLLRAANTAEARNLTQLDPVAQPLGEAEIRQIQAANPTTFATVATDLYGPKQRAWRFDLLEQGTQPTPDQYQAVVGADGIVYRLALLKDVEGYVGVLIEGGTVQQVQNGQAVLNLAGAPIGLATFNPAGTDNGTYRVAQAAFIGVLP